MPLSQHHFHRLTTVFGGPYFFGASYDRNPSRLIKTIPLNNPPVIDARQTLALGKEAPQPLHLKVCQLERCVSVVARILELWHSFETQHDILAAIAVGLHFRKWIP